MNGQPSQPALPPAHHDDAASYTNGSAIPNKRKHQELKLPDEDTSSVVSVPATSSPPRPSSPLQPSSPPSHADRSSSSTPAPPYTSEAQKVYIARTAPHLLGQSSIPSGSRTPSAPPSARSSPSSDDGRLTPDNAGSTPSSTHNKSHHIVPEGYRGPKLIKSDAEDFVPIPHLAPVPGSTTLYNTTNFAFNRNGWRYTAAGPATQHLPQTVFKTLETRPANVHWCWSDRSQYSHISADASLVATEKGFRSARTNIGVRQGEWYAEIEILLPEHLEPGFDAPGPIPPPMKDGPHIRLGWGRREAPLNAPAGFDGYSYAYRDKTGDKVTLSRPLPYGKPYKAGDVVGMYIKLPKEREPEDSNDPANIKRERIPIRWRNQLYFESLEYPKTREMEQLYERSIKGNSLKEAYKGIEGTGVFEPYDPTHAFSAVEGVNGTSTSTSTSGGGGGGSGSAKVKNRKNPGTTSKPSGPITPSLRPIPTLPGSKIGFFVNGEPQGIAFRDIFDYRPLRVKGFTNLNPSFSTNSTKLSVKSRKQPDSKKLEPLEPVINVKPRENVFDDGALGYFPFVSSYGGARARLINGENGFRFPPPDDIEGVLEGVTPRSDFGSVTKRNEEEVEGGGERKWKGLWQRFEEHLSEMWKYDLLDEAKAQAVANKQAEEKKRKSDAAKEKYAAAKKKHAAALARSDAASPAPLVELEEGGDRTLTGMGTKVEDMELDADADAGAERVLDDVNTPEPPPQALRLPLADTSSREEELWKVEQHNINVQTEDDVEMQDFTL